MKVTVVFDRAFGARDVSPDGDAFWLIESPVNRSLAERLWRTADFDPNSAVFKDGDATPTDSALGIFSTVDLHHPGWTDIAFVGVRLTDELRRQFADDGAQAVPTNDGFMLTR